MPNPNALPLEITERQRLILEGWLRATNTPQSKVLRAKIILLAGEGYKNKEIVQQLQVDQNTVRKWRLRWHQADFIHVEENLTDKQLKAIIEATLRDQSRPGTPPTFTAEQVLQIVALACESPEALGYPFSHWTNHLLALESIKRGIVKDISGGSVRLFLKGSRNQATSGKTVA